ncbi:hypothetical protein [Chitinophaga polysaccharea]|uniref:hypothetical protein n=1 Tax=Chitinophaga polysaccharea TaxID=1293035 RepID=UPI001C8EA131|nr:hypothetical protein [Chitinophaga polysaccharea]
MGKIKIAAFSVSMDGFGAGPRQSLKDPLGIRGEELHTWMFQKTDGNSGTGVDNIVQKSMENIGSWIMGRNMFGPQVVSSLRLRKPKRWQMEKKCN